VIRFLFPLILSFSLLIRGQEAGPKEFAQSITQQELKELLYVYATILKAEELVAKVKKSLWIF